MNGDNPRSRRRLTFFVKAAELTQRVATGPIQQRHDLTYAQLGMLLGIARVGGLSGAALARMHGITAQSAGEVIATLVRRGVVERRSDPDHARMLTAHLTGAGKNLVALIEPELDAIEQELIDGLSDAELETARHVLSTMIGLGGVVPTEGI